MLVLLDKHELSCLCFVLSQFTRCLLFLGRVVDVSVHIALVLDVLGGLLGVAALCHFSAVPVASEMLKVPTPCIRQVNT